MKAAIQLRFGARNLPALTAILLAGSATGSSANPISLNLYGGAPYDPVSTLIALLLGLLIELVAVARAGQSHQLRRRMGHLRVPDIGG
jgi:O-antigen ligase